MVSATPGRQPSIIAAKYPLPDRCRQRMSIASAKRIVEWSEGFYARQS